MFPARVRAGPCSALAVLALSGCSAGWGCSDTTAERGAAGVRVRVEDVYGQPVGVTAEVVGWRLGPHPQEPSGGDRVRFRFRFDGAGAGAGAGASGGSDPVVEACAVDEERVVLGCRTISPSQAFGPNGDPTGAPATTGSLSRTPGGWPECW
ncbi:hypothetical protein ACFZAU_36815 [Streptomyces sp. NPDC008238]